MPSPSNPCFFSVDSAHSPVVKYEQPVQIKCYGYERFDSTISTKPACLVWPGHMVGSIPQSGGLFSAIASCQQTPNPNPPHGVGLLAVLSRARGCSPHLRVGGVVLEQDHWPQDWLDAFYAAGDVASVGNHPSDRARHS